jgi:hypothetical protein
MNPTDYQLFIDNESGTYRPNPDYLYLLREFILSNFPGLHVTTLDCQKGAERMGALKDEQRECKKKHGNQMTYSWQRNGPVSVSAEFVRRSGRAKWHSRKASHFLFLEGA